MPSLVHSLRERVRNATTSTTTVTGVVETKTLLAEADGRREGLLMVHEGAANGDGDLLGPDGRVGARTAARLEARYDRLFYGVHVRLDGADTLNGFDRGATAAYRADRDAFDAAAIGERVEAVVEADGRVRTLTPR